MVRRDPAGGPSVRTQPQTSKISRIAAFGREPSQVATHMRKRASTSSKSTLVNARAASLQCSGNGVRNDGATAIGHYGLSTLASRNGRKGRARQDLIQQLHCAGMLTHVRLVIAIICIPPRTPRSAERTALFEVFNSASSSQSQCVPLGRGYCPSRRAEVFATRLIRLE